MNSLEEMDERQGTPLVPFPAPPAPPAPKRNGLKLAGIVCGTVVVLAIIGAISGGNAQVPAAAAPSAAAPVAIVPDPVPACLNTGPIFSLTTKATSYTSAASKDLKAYDLAGASADLRNAAGAWHEVAGMTSDYPQVSQHATAIASDLNSAATNLDTMDLDGVMADMKDATREVDPFASALSAASC